MDERDKLLTAIATLQSQRGDADTTAIDAALEALQEKLSTLDGNQKTLRQVTVLFLDLVGSTALSRELDPEDISEIVDGGLRRLSAIVCAHGGKVLQYAGDSILAVFGATTALEDDPVRAVKCGLALVQKAQEIRAGIQSRTTGNAFNVRIGIHTGPVLLGGGVDDTSTIRGVTVNIAARMEQSAPPGSVRISHETERHVRGLFDLSNEPPLTVKGFDEPMRSHLVSRVRDALGQPARGLDGVYTPLVGRQPEMQRLRQSFELSAVNKRVAVAFVSGDPGLGKSRLAHEFEAWLCTEAAAVVLRARAQPYSESMPYGVVRDLVVRRFGILDSDSRSTASEKLKQELEERSEEAARPSAMLIGRLIGLDVEPSSEAQHISEGLEARNQAFSILGRYLASTAKEQRAAVLIIDDLHWADDGSLEFIEHLVSSCGDAPVMLLCLTRPEFWERRKNWLAPAARIDLAPLERQGSRQLVDALLARMSDVPAALRDLITATAEGNPYFIEELIGVLIADGVIRVDDSGWHVVPELLLTVRVPTTLAGVLQARLDALPARQRATLQQASVVGDVFWDDALWHLGASEQVDLEELVQRDLARGKTPSTFEGTNEYAFKHHLLHAVTYQSVLRADKRRLHRATAEWLLARSRERSSEYHGLVADHFEKAGDVEKAILYLRKAAADAWYAYALQSALAYFDRAIALMPAGGDKFDVMLARVEAAFDTRDAILEKRCIRELEAMAEELDDDAKRAIAASVLASHAAHEEDLAGTRESALKALTFAERSGHVPSAIRAHNQWGFALVAAGDLASATEHAEQGLSLSRKTCNPRGQANALGLLALIAEEQGDFARARPYRDEAIDFYTYEMDRVWKQWAICRAAACALLLGDYEVAIERLLSAYATIKAIGSRAHERDAAAQLAHAARVTGKFGEVFEWVGKAGGLEGEEAEVSLVPHLLLYCGDAHAALGRPDEARRCYERCVALFESWDKPLGTLDGRCGLARVSLSFRDAAQAATHVADAAARVADGWTGGGCADPAQVMLTTYEALKAVSDPRAERVLYAARAMVADQASKLAADASEKYLWTVKANRRICEIWKAAPLQTPGA